MIKHNHPENPRTTKTIGLFINVLHHRYQGMIGPGIFDGAKQRGYQIIAFVGKMLNSATLYDKQENVIYKLACEKNIDGLLIITGSIGNLLSPQELKEFCYQYKDLPTVCLATPIAGVTSVWVDNKTGMRELVTHFIHHHRYRRLAFIRGPIHNPEAEMRFQVFKEVLAENDLPLIPELVVEGNFVWTSGRDGINALLDRKVPFDAVLAANDEMLIGAYRELVLRGIKVPEDVALGGFDNIDETKTVTPAITTVAQPLYEEALKAVSLLADLIEGQSAPELLAFPTRLLLRRSCGCNAQFNHGEWNPHLPPSRPENDEQILSAVPNHVIVELIRRDSEIQSDTPKEFHHFQELIGVYVEAFLNDLKKRESKLIKLISDLTTRVQNAHIDLDFFRILLSKIHHYLSPLLAPSRALAARASQIHTTALTLLLDAITRHERNKFIQGRDYNWSMLGATKALSTTFNREALRAALLMILPSLNIEFCFIALFEAEEGVPEIPPPRARVFLCYQANAPHQTGEEGLFFDTQDLLPSSLFAENRGTNLTVFPLLNENDHFGYIVFNLDPRRDPMLYETLQGHISAALKGAALFRTVKNQSEALIAQKEELSQHLSKLRQVMGGFITSMSLLVEARDPYTAGHQIRVANLARAIATERGLPKDQIEAIRVSGVLHDLGKLYIPSQILNKPGQLMDVEFNLIKRHPQIGYDILKSVEWPWPVAEIVLQHHERLDGSGYPSGLKGEEISIEAQIITVADVVEAMASHRPYRPALGIEQALEEISRKRGDFYDPITVDCCLRLFNEKGFAFETETVSFQYPRQSE